MNIMSEISNIFANTLSIVANIFYQIKLFTVTSIRNLYSIKEKLKDLYKTNYELGIYHFKALNYSDTIFRFKLLQLFFPNRVTNDANFYIGQSYVEKYNYQDGFKYLTVYLKNEPNGEFKEEASFFLNMIENKITSNNRIPLGTIKRRFDAIASKYNLINIENRSEFPQKILFKIVKEVSENIDMKFPCSMIDLGCGTGYIGNEIKKSKIVDSLIGIDISKKMIDFAEKYEFEKSPSYSELIVDDIDSYFTSKRRKSKNKYDIIVASDLLQFYGEVDKLFELARSISSNKSIFALNFPLLQDIPHSDKEFSYQYKYFLFSKEFVIKIAAQNGWITIKQEDFRYPNDAYGTAIIFK